MIRRSQSPLPFSPSVANLITSLVARGPGGTRPVTQRSLQQPRASARNYRPDADDGGARVNHRRVFSPPSPLSLRESPVWGMASQPSYEFHLSRGASRTRTTSPPRFQMSANAVVVWRETRPHSVASWIGGFIRVKFSTLLFEISRERKMIFNFLNYCRVGT